MTTHTGPGREEPKMLARSQEDLAQPVSIGRLGRGSRSRLT
jgi:hypothetical protein